MFTAHRKGCLAALVALLGLVGVAVFVNDRTRARGDRPASRGIAVKAERREVIRSLRLSGKIKARKTAEVKAPVSGRLVSFLEREGVVVRAGQPIATIEPDQSQSILLEQARIEVRVKSIALQQAEADYERASHLTVAGLLPIADLDRTRHNYQMTKETLELARSQLRILESQTPPTPHGAHAFQLLAPVSGTLLAPLLSPGETIVAGTAAYANGGTVLTKIADTSSFVVQIDISEADILELRRGMPAMVTPAGSKKRRYRGHLESIGVEGSTSQNLTTYRGEVALDEPASFLPEMSADVDITLVRKGGVIALPSAAVVRNSRDKAFVYKRGELRPVPVSVGLEGDDYVEITEGVRDGETFEIVPRSVSNPGRP